MAANSPSNHFAFSGNGPAMLGTVSSTAALLLLFPAGAMPAHGATFVTAGRGRAGDGGGATFRYDAPDSVTADNGGTVRVDAAGRRWRAVNIHNCVSVRVFGAIADGVSDCSAAILAANSWLNPEGPSGCLLPPGDYAVAADINLPNRLQGAGGVLGIAAGRTVTLHAAPDGPLQSMFAGSGSVAVGAVSAIGYPEWFGAVTNTMSVDCTPAINACVAAFPITQFQRAVYYTKSTCRFTISGRRIQGMPERNVADMGTSIVVQSATLDTILVGAVTDPGAINSYTHNIDIYGIWADRTLPVVPPASGSPVSQTCAWRIQYGLNIYMDTCEGAEASSGFIYASLVKSYFRRCQAKRAIAGTTPINDIWNGHYAFGLGPTHLASVRFDQCGADCNIDGLTDPVGMRAAGSFTDMYINDFEADACSISILLDGTGATKPSIDCYVSGGIFDQVTKYGLYCLNQPAGSQIHINKCYAVCTHTGIAGFAIENNAGSVSLVGSQASGLGAGAGVATLCGLKIINSGRVNCAGNMWSELDGAIYMTGAYACQIRDSVANNVLPSANPAIRMIGCHSNLVQPNIDAATIGVALDASCRNNEINTSAINGLTATTKLVYVDKPITAAGIFGTNNLASGILA